MNIYTPIRRKLRNWYRRILYPSSLQYEGPFNFFLVDDNPLIVLTFTPCGLGHVKTMAEKVSPRYCHFLVGFWWSMKDAGRVDAFQRKWKKIQRKHPNIDLQVLCNAKSEQELFRSRTDINAHHVNQNCMIDEGSWEVMANAKKEYDAVYNARVGEYKRIELAYEVKKLAIITAPHQGNIEEDEYAKELREYLSHAKWLNFEQERYRRLPREEVHEHVSRAHTGLILSGTEGACYSVGEYLLSGIPVVSTPSEGGRDVWFNSETCIVVNDTPEAVAEGVREWKRRSPDPHHVREETLKVLDKHRNKFFSVVNNIRKKGGKNRSFKYDWIERSINKMRVICEPEDFEGMLEKSKFDKRARGEA